MHALVWLWIGCGGGETPTTPTDPVDTSADTAAYTPPTTPPTTTTTWTVAGEVTGLQGASVVITQGEDGLELTADGPFSFTVDDGASYAVVVDGQPTTPDQTCTVTGGEGVATADVDDIRVQCVTPIRHVVIVGIDGLGGAWFEEADAPILDGLRAQGVSTLTAQNVLPTDSSPNWMSMIAGSGPDQHGVTSNGWDPGDSDPTPTIFAALRASRPDATIGVFHDWGDFGRLVEDGVPNAIESPGDEVETMAAAIDYLDEAPDLLFVHLDHVDHAGHGSTWGSQTYMQSIAEADALLGELVEALQDRDMWSYTALLVTSDHGGASYSHGNDTADERAIPIIAVAPQIDPAAVEREVRIWDVAPTAAFWLGIPAHDTWIGNAMPELGGPPIPTTAAKPVVEEVADFTWVYDDSGTGAHDDVSIWRPVVPDGFALLGDVVHASHDPPSWSTLVVRDDPAVVAQPLGYESVWDDGGSGGSHDVTLYHPIPPLGYTCLGSVAVGAHDTPPSPELVRCVHTDVLGEAKPVFTWDDSGSGAYLDVSLWTCQGGSGPTSFITRRHSSDPGSDRCASL